MRTARAGSYYDAATLAAAFNLRRCQACQEPANAVFVTDGTEINLCIAHAFEFTPYRTEVRIAPIRRRARR